MEKLWEKKELEEDAGLALDFLPPAVLVILAEFPDIMDQTHVIVAILYS